MLIHFSKIAADNHEFAQMQESARFALHFLRQDIAQAGFMGCARLTPDFPVHDYGVSPIHQIRFDNNIRIYENGEGLPAEFKIDSKADTDIILIRKLASETAHLQFPFMGGNEIIVNGLTPKFESYDDIALVDCDHAVLLKISSVKHATKQKTQYLFFDQNIPEQFSIESQVGKLETVVFFIQNPNRALLGPPLIASLYMKKIGEQSLELVDGVNGMKAQVVLVSKAGEIIFKQPDQIHDWSQARGVSINLEFTLGKKLPMVIEV